MRPIAALSFFLALLLSATLSATFVRADDKPPVTVGEWALQKDTSVATVGSGETTAYLYVWVSKVDGKRITIMHQLVDAAGKLALSEPRAKVLTELGDAKKAKPKTAYPEETLEVKGKKFLCRKVQLEGELLWVSPEIPVYGVVRAIVADKVGKATHRTELLDWGASGGAPRALK